MSQAQSSLSFQDSSLERSFVWSLGITVLPVLSGFIISWVIARWGGPRVIGTVSWVMSFATAALILGKFGLDVATSRLASEYGVKSPGRLRALFGTALRFRLLFTLSVAILSAVFAPHIASFFGDVSLTNGVRVGALIIVCASVYEFIEGFLIGLNRHATVYRVRAVHLISRVTFACVLVLAGLGATAILGGYCAAWFIAVAVYAALLTRSMPRSQSSESRDIDTRRLLVLSATLAISSASVTIYSHMDRLMLGYFTDVEQVGQYSVARNIAEVSLFPVFAMIMMLRPALAARFTSGRLSESAHIIRRSLRFSFVSGVLFAAIFAALGVPLVTVVFSDSFWLAGELMLFFVGVIVFRSLGSVILPALVAAERTRVYAYLTTISAVLNFGLNIVLIPRYGARGAIMATIISYGVLLIVGLRQVFVTYALKLTARAVSAGLRTILAGAMSAGVVWLIINRLQPRWESFMWAALIAALYTLLLFAFRVGTPGDVRAMVSNLRQSKG
jgi:O-antigen/teichoic acid export membrane protein